MVWLPDSQKTFEDMFIHFDRMHEHNRRTLHDIISHTAKSVCYQPRSQRRVGGGARAPPPKVSVPPPPKPTLPCTYSPRHLVRRCHWHTAVPWKYTQNCMILRAKFQFFSSGNTPEPTTREEVTIQRIYVWGRVAPLAFYVIKPNFANENLIAQ